MGEQHQGVADRVLADPVAYTLEDRHFGKFDIKNSANAWWLDKIKVNSIIQAFKIDSTVEEARSYAGISKIQWEYFIKNHPTFRDDVIDNLRPLLTLKARQTVGVRIEESYNNAMDYLSRKRKKEFSQRTETETDITITHDYAPDIKKIMDEAGRKLRESYMLKVG